MADSEKFDWKDGTLPKVKAHTVAKLDLLTTYLDWYFDTLATNLSIKRMKITLIEGFAGGGEETFEGETLKGTPLRLLDAVVRGRERLAKARRAGEFDLDANFIFIDKNRNACANLDEVLRRDGYYDEFGDSIEIRNGVFEDQVDELIQQSKGHTKNGRAIFVLDQCGYSLVSQSSIHKILTELPKAEIILTFAVGNLIRSLNTSLNFEKAGKIVGLRSDELRELANSTDPGVVQTTLQRAIAPLIQKSFGAPFFTRFFLRSEKANNNLWIMHLAQHETARNVMVEAHWRHSNASLHRGPGGIDMLGFDPRAANSMLAFHFGDEDRNKSHEQLKEDIAELLHGREGLVTMQDIISGTANCSVATVEQYQDALTALKSERRIDAFTTKLSPKRGGRLQITDRVRLSSQPMLNLIWMPQPKK